MPNALVWFRDDLRLDDQPALQAALAQGHAPIPVYVHAPEEEGDWTPGAASDAWRRRSLRALDIWIGGRTDVALRRTARYGDGWFPSFVTPAEFGSGMEALGRYGAERGRSIDPREAGLAYVKITHAFFRECRAQTATPCRVRPQSDLRGAHPQRANRLSARTLSRGAAARR